MNRELDHETLVRAGEICTKYGAAAAKRFTDEAFAKLDRDDSAEGEYTSRLDDDREDGDNTSSINPAPTISAKDLERARRKGLKKTKKRAKRAKRGDDHVKRSKVTKLAAKCDVACMPGKGGKKAALLAVLQKLGVRSDSTSDGIPLEGKKTRYLFERARMALRDRQRSDAAATAARAARVDVEAFDHDTPDVIKAREEMIRANRSGGTRYETPESAATLEAMREHAANHGRAGR